ncbi:MAG: hypothetical protein HOP10_04090 [Chitinophagaceae bacterium]|nr:hypothetical protein [Chitinophagaceae bacterium]
MENENLVPGTNASATPQTSPAVSPAPSFQGNTLLLVAALLILLGFFLPWINTGIGRGDYDEIGFGVPTINGTNLISLAGRIPEAGWLLTIYLILIPVGSLLVAYNAYQKTFSEKTMMFGIAAAVFLPITLFALYIIIPKYELFDMDDFGRGSLKLGIGFIMMVIGSVYCFIYAMRRISQNMNRISPGPMFKFGAIGGGVTGALTYLIFDNMNDSEGAILYIYLGLFISGILLSAYLYKNNTRVNSNYHSSIVTGFIFSGAYAFSLFIIASITSNGAATGMQGQLFIFLLVGQCLFGFIISSMSGNTGVMQMSTANTVDNSEAPIANAGQAEIPVQSKTVSPPFDWGAFYKKNKRTIITGSILLVCGVAAWILLKPNPERDGRKAAKAECNCKADHDKAITKAYEDFISGFDSAHFKSRSEARAKLQETMTGLETANIQCSTTAKEKFEKLGKKFRKDNKKAAKFYAAYYKSINSCVIGTDRAALSNKLEEKIRTIKEPEPDIEKIKLDLINQSIPGWTFSYLSEIKEASVANTTRIDDRIEYTVDLKLESYSTNEQHDAQVIIAYNQGDDGWYMSNMNEVFITYNNMAPVGEWKTITPLSGCSYTIIDGGNKYWVQDGSYGTKYKGGGDDGETFQLSGSQIYIASREDKPVNIIFKYTPNSQ